ncbi:MAG: ribosome recycling factor [Patescibacteria group bacterium]|nr:ribosome recycling factor [Patescibacteria group bacterium]
MTIIDEKKFKFDNAIAHLKSELESIRTGRANPALVENLLVDYYGSKTPLQQLASISTPDSQLILIQPWDKACMKDVERAIHNSELGLSPISDGNAIRLPIPSLTEERRKEIVKLVHQKIEAAHISIRTIREEIWKTLKDKKTAGEISEDEMFLQQKNLQKVVEDYNNLIKEISEEKEKEVMTI